MEFQRVGRIREAGIDPRLGPVKGVDVVTDAIVGKNGIDAGESDGEAETWY